MCAIYSFIYSINKYLPNAYCVLITVQWDSAENFPAFMEKSSVFGKEEEHIIKALTFSWHFLYVIFKSQICQYKYKFIGKSSYLGNL